MFAGAHHATRKCDAKSRAGKMPAVRRADRRRLFPKEAMSYVT